MRIMQATEIKEVLHSLTAGDEVKVTYEIDGDWAVAICQYDSHRPLEHTTLIKFRLYKETMSLGINEIVEMERRAR